MNANINTNTAAADLSADEALLASMLDDFIEPEVEVAEDKQELDIDLTNESAAPSSDAEILDDLFGDEPLANADDLAADLAAVTASIEKAESVKAIYEEQGKDDAVDHLFGGQPEADKPTDPAAASAKKAKKAAAKKEDPTTVEEPQTASEEQPAQEPQSQVKEAAPKEPKAPRLTYVTNKKSEVLAQKLGSKASEYLLLEVADAALDEDGLKAKMDEVLATIDACGQKKVQEKAVMLFGYMSKGGTLNEVMKRAFTVLVRDGFITSGDKGNLHANLLTKPYSLGTARAQAGQMLCLFPMLKIALKDGRGRLVANPDSLILMKVSAELGLSAS